ncbi:MAG TPA: hypothetical protein EYO58_09175 [Flavobacteriales bacterium]|jgi:hypothetical protein|nr:hypothetical protein [Flavobacteriales bacterium]HIO15688.1 hypothetical protein [Flavobacteriales bacterium]
MGIDTPIYRSKSQGITDGASGRVVDLTKAASRTKKTRKIKAESIHFVRVKSLWEKEWRKLGVVGELNCADLTFVGDL